MSYVTEKHIRITNLFTVPRELYRLRYTFLLLLECRRSQHYISVYLDSARPLSGRCTSSRRPDLSYGFTIKNTSITPRTVQHAKTQYGVACSIRWGFARATTR